MFGFFQAGESLMFNTFLQELKEKIINKLGHRFWLLIVKSKKGDSHYILNRRITFLLLGQTSSYNC